MNDKSSKLEKEALDYIKKKRISTLNQKTRRESNLNDLVQDNTDKVLNTKNSNNDEENYNLGIITA